MALPKTKRKKPRAAPRIQRGAKLQEPNWDGWEDWTGEQIHKHRRHTHSWYYEHFKPADLYAFVPDWMADNDYSKDDIKALKAAPGRALSITASIVARMDMKGAPRFSDKEAAHWESLPGTMGELNSSIPFLKKAVTEAIEEGRVALKEKKQEEKDTKNVYVPTIQERIRDQSLLMSEEIDEWLETWVTDSKNFDPKGFNFKEHFKKVGVTQAHARKMKSFWENELVDFNDLERMPTAGQLKKMSEHDQDMWAQLKEGYSHLKKADIKKLREAIDSVNAELDFIIDQAKATRKPRKAKPKSATKLVEKLKYLKIDSKYQLASVSPDQIVGANELWVFNVKTRKLGKYVAEIIDPKGMNRGNSGLSVKGTTIIGFNEAESIQKTLRKPDEQLKAFKAAGKVALRKFLDEINTTDTKLNGRCNPDTVLLKIS